MFSQFENLQEKYSSRQMLYHIGYDVVKALFLLTALFIVLDICG